MTKRFLTNWSLSFLFLLLSFSISLTTCLTPTYCQSHSKCKCSDDSKEIKCKFDSTTVTADFIDTRTLKLDLSQNNLTNVVFGDVSLNLDTLSLSDNRIQIIHDNMFARLPHLKRLDLSLNRIDTINDESVFEVLNVLEYLNLSRAFVQDYKMHRDLCNLFNLRTLDVSHADLSEFSLQCWGETSGKMVNFYARFSRNVEASIKNWLPYLGSTSLKLIDLSDSDLRNIDATSWPTKTLTHLYLNNLPRLELSSLNSFFMRDQLFTRLETLHIRNVNARRQSLDLNSLISMSNVTQLNMRNLDISHNQYDDDLNTLFFGQHKLAPLVSLCAANNSFTQCSSKIEKNFLTNLKCLDLSRNKLSGVECLNAIKPMENIEMLHMSHNRLGFDGRKDLSLSLEFFTTKVHLSSLDLSHNNFSYFVTYFKEGHTSVNKLDLSFNRLTLFRFLSLTQVKAKAFDVDLDENASPNSGVDDYDDDGQVISSDDTGTEFKYDDDQRYIFIDKLILSSNSFTTAHIQHMLQTVRNIKHMDISFNDKLRQVVGMSNSAPITSKIVLNDKNEEVLEEMEYDETNNSNNSTKDTDETVREILCIDELDLSNSRLTRLPNMQHTCVNKLDLSENQIKGMSHLVISQFSVYFLDYLDLKANNITQINLIVSEEKFVNVKKYTSENSPYHYFYGTEEAQRALKQNASAHTIIDLQGNDYFKCDCSLVEQMSHYVFVRIKNKCFTKELQDQCARNKQNMATITSLNRRFRIVFIVSCFVLVVLTLFTLNYLYTDILKQKNTGCVSRARLQAYRLASYFDCCRRLRMMCESGNKATGGVESGVQYSKLGNNAGASQLELNNA